MNLVAHFCKSSVGKKYIMAITGGGLFAFAFFHMMGNLQIFLGRKAINHYGEVLHSNPEFLWPARIGLVVFAIIHVVTAILLTIENRAARTERYAVRTVIASSFGSRTMIYSGVLLAVFLVYHLLHFTVQVPGVNLTGQDFMSFVDQGDHHERHDVYRMLVVGFSNPWVSLFYILAMGCLCLHLSHGVQAMFQSLGAKSHTYEVLIKRYAIGIAWVLFLGYSSVPVAILLGVVK